jgi:hypothetical protein
MTFTDWLRETRTRYQTQSIHSATRDSSRAFWRGISRRTIDPYLGSVWWERDWDVLVVLDGLRVDLARDVVDDEVASVWSPASTSIDWINRHFADEYRDEWERTAYVTANPFASHDTTDAKSADLHEKNIGYFDPVYERAFGDVDGITTTPPEAVTDAAIYAWRTADVDQMIVHYMQPHQPFIGRSDWESVYSNLENLAGEVNQGGPDVWHRCRDGKLDRNDVWNAYRDNLQWVLDDVESRLLRNVDARAALSADHGNGMGEWGVWSHPPGSIAPAVRKVPVWFREASDERTVVPPVPETGETASQADADISQLQALGYL